MSHAIATSFLSTHQARRPHLDVQSLVCGFMSGSITGLFAITLSLSVASLIFSGALASQVNVGVGLALFGSIVLSLFISLTSSCRGMVASTQEVPGALLALIAGGLVAAFPSSAG